MALLGNGIPSAIQRAAENASLDDVLNVLRLASLEPIRAETRVGIEIQLSRRTDERDDPSTSQDKKQRLNHLIEELRSLQESFPTLEDLSIRKHRLEIELDVAACSEAFINANGLEEEMLQVSMQMAKERHMEDLVHRQRALHAMVQEASPPLVEQLRARFSLATEEILELAYGRRRRGAPSD